ncbi:uncharacterized protein LOC129235294 [Uloborus diversus]|uniref:uncharacterized protein LOC129235294 n=1 Tax=Uloborus diversus TaxID=327109 RepID=UPI00240A0407|nr:uncharacterized protein LOC129235294 [Uloborus diversus]
MLLGIYIILAFYISSSACHDKNTSCITWDEIETNMKLHDDHVLCVKEEECSGMNCSGSAYGYNISAGIKLNSCDESPNLSFSIDIPKLGVKAVKKTVHNGDYILLKDNLRIEFEMQTNLEELTFGMFAHFVNKHNHSVLDIIPMRIPIFQHISFPVLPCASSGNQNIIAADESVHISKKPILLSKSTSGNQSNCSITNSSCKSNELCQQMNRTQPFGICICISDYERNEDGICIYHPTLDSTTEPPHSHSVPQISNDSNVTLLLTAILVPIAVIVAIVGIVYATIKFRVCQHLRRRLRVQVYEHVLLGQDEEDTESESPNPVV